MKAKLLLEQLFSDEDLACDFVENEVGAHDFLSNWPLFKKAVDPVKAVQEWLISTKTPDADATKIVAIIDTMAAGGLSWLTGFNRRLPY